MSVILDRPGQTEVTILARILGNDHDPSPEETARYVLSLGFNDDDKTRMHNLAVRNQQGDLSEPEKEEMFAYAKAGTLLSILKSKARRALKVRPNKRKIS